MGLDGLGQHDLIRHELYGAAAYADDAMPVYDLGSDDVYDTYEAPKEEAAPPPEPKAAEPEPEPRRKNSRRRLLPADRYRRRAIWGP